MGTCNECELKGKMVTALAMVYRYMGIESVLDTDLRREISMSELMLRKKDERIEELGLIDLKKYACPKIQHKAEWYWDCLDDCPSYSTCKVGQRAAAILDEETEHKGKAKQAEAMEHSKEAYSKRRREAARAKCRAALGSGDPVKYLIDNYGNTESSAKKLIEDWKDKFYDLFGLDAPPIRRGASPANEAAMKRRKDRLYEKVRTAVASGNAQQWLIDHGKTPKQAQASCYNWRRKFPELFEGYDKAQPVQKEEQMEEGDEISVADFVSEFEQKEVIEAVENTDKENVREGQENGIEGQLEAKYDQIAAQMEILQTEIKEREDKLAWLEKQLDALAMVKNLFDPI